jgi:hypothetical protein
MRYAGQGVLARRLQRARACAFFYMRAPYGYAYIQSAVCSCTWRMGETIKLFCIDEKLDRQKTSVYDSHMVIETMNQTDHLQPRRKTMRIVSTQRMKRFFLTLMIKRSLSFISKRLKKS